MLLVPLVFSCKAGLFVFLWIPVHQEGLAIQLVFAEEFGKLLEGSDQDIPSE